MPRSPRPATGGIVTHVLNRSNARLPLFERPDDYELFEQTLEQARRISRAERQSGVVDKSGSLLTVLRYVERNAVRAGLAQAGRAVAVVQPVGSHSRRRRPAGPADRPARRLAGRLAQVGQPAAEPRGTASPRPVHRPRPTVRQPGVGVADGGAVRPGIDPPPPRPA